MKRDIVFVLLGFVVWGGEEFIILMNFKIK